MHDRYNMTDINRTACTFSRPALNANTLKLKIGRASCRERM